MHFINISGFRAKYEAQKQGAEMEAMARAKRIYVEQQCQFARLDSQGNQPRVLIVGIDGSPVPVI
jgi:hypothetical protein